MTETTEDLEVTEEVKQNELVEVVKTSGLEVQTGNTIVQKFTAFFEQAETWKRKAEALVVTDASQTREMKMAREARLAIRDIRLKADKVRKSLKADSLRYGKAVQDVYNIIEQTIVPIEEHLDKQEKFIEIQEAKRKELLAEERLTQLQKYDFQHENGFQLDVMSEEMFQSLFNGVKKAYEDKIEADKKAEEDRIAREKAEKEEQKKQEKIRIENEKLKEAAKKKEKENKEKQALQQKRLSELLPYNPYGADVNMATLWTLTEAKYAEILTEKKSAFEKEEAYRKAEEEKERKKRETLEAELKAKADAEAKAKKEAEEVLKAKQLAEKKAQSAPDKVKLIKFAWYLDNTVPAELKEFELASDEAQKILVDAKGLIIKVSNYIKEKAELL